MRINWQDVAAEGGTQKVGLQSSKRASLFNRHACKLSIL
jgi:hypothetical protein